MTGYCLTFVHRYGETWEVGSEANKIYTALTGKSKTGKIPCHVSGQLFLP